MTRADEGWSLPFAGQPVNVTEACSATNFCLMSTARLAVAMLEVSKRTKLDQNAALNF